MLHQTFGPFNYHLGYPLMTVRQLVKGRIDNFHIGAHNGLPYVRNLLRALIYQKNHQMHVRIIGGDSLGNLLQQSRLTCFGR